MTFDLITQSQKDDADATLTLINKFNPLLNKYAHKLYYEDAYCDLLADFIEFIHNIQLNKIRDKSEGSMVSYIHKSICDNYIKRSVYLKKLHNLVLFSDLSDNELHYVETTSAASDSYFKYELPNLQNILTKSELQVVNMLYLQGYTVKKTACILGVTR